MIDKALHNLERSLEMKKDLIELFAINMADILVMVANNGVSPNRVLLHYGPDSHIRLKKQDD